MSDDLELKHYGKKGMRWGVTTKSASSSSSSKPSLASRVKNLPPEQKRKIAIALVGTGAAVAASMVAGPVGGMTVGSLSKAVDAAFTTRTTTRTSTIDSFGNQTSSYDVQTGG